MIPLGAVTGAVVNLNHPDRYVHWSFILTSVANLVVVAVMLALFVAALALPFMRSPTLAPEAKSDHPADPTPPPSTWTGKLRQVALRYLPPGKLLPETQPAYVASWVYVFGVATIAALAVVISTGLVLAIFGPVWWHATPAGHFVNSLHLWAKFWMAAWRGRRTLTWMTGVVCFLVAVVEAFTGYLSQTNFDSQWIAFESKDAFNASGIGAVLDPMNFGQALMLHIALLPLALVAFVAFHVLLVRARGVVPPIDARPEHLGVGGEPATTASETGSKEQEMAGR